MDEAQEWSGDSWGLRLPRLYFSVSDNIQWTLRPWQLTCIHGYIVWCSDVLGGDISVVHDAALPAEKPPYSLLQLMLYALRLGTLGFGGPVALVGYMHRDLVEKRKGLSFWDGSPSVTSLLPLSPWPRWSFCGR